MNYIEIGSLDIGAGYGEPEPDMSVKHCFIEWNLFDQASTLLWAMYALL